jgi:hypothetical protein
MASIAALKKDLRKKIKKVLANVSDAAASTQSELIHNSQLSSHTNESYHAKCR